MKPQTSNELDFKKVDTPVLVYDIPQPLQKTNRTTSQDHSAEDLHRQNSSQIASETKIQKNASKEDLGANFDIFERYQQSRQSKLVGPKQLKKGINNIFDRINVELWKNIPQPVCFSTTGLMTCVNDLKRFSLGLDTRFSNLTASTTFSLTEARNLAEDRHNQILEAAASLESRFNQRIQQVEQEFQAQLDQRLAEFKASSEVWTAEKITLETNMLKPWIGKLADDKILVNYNKITAETTKKIKETQAMFCVPELIGSVGCPFPDYPAFTQNAFDRINLLIEGQQKMTTNFQLQIDEQKQVSINQNEQREVNSAALNNLITQKHAVLATQLGIFQRLYERGQSELQNNIEKQNLGQEIRVKTVLICNDWNDKIIQIDALAKNNKQFQAKIDELQDSLDRIQSQVAYQQTENEKFVFEYKLQLEKQEKKSKEALDESDEPSPKDRQLKEPNIIKPSPKQAEQSLRKGNPSSKRGSSTLLINNSETPAQETQAKDAKQSIRKSSAHSKNSKKSGKSSRSGQSASRTSLRSQKLVNKKSKFQPQPSLETQQEVVRSRIQSAQPLRNNKKSIKINQESLEQFNYDRKINVTQNFLELDDLTDRVRTMELQLIKIERFKKIYEDKQERKRRKTIRPSVDRSLAAVLELGKLNAKFKQKSASNSPENRQQNVQVNVQSRGPLLWEAEKKKWVKEQAFMPTLDMKIDKVPQEMIHTRSRSRDKNQKKVSVVSTELQHADYSMRVNKTMYGYSKPLSQLLNIPSNQGFDSESTLKLYKQVAAKEQRKYDQSSNLSNQFDKKILESHAQIYYTQEGVQISSKVRPHTGIRAQDLTSSANNFKKNKEDSPRRNLLPQLSVPQKLGSQQSLKHMKVKSAQM